MIEPPPAAIRAILRTRNEALARDFDLLERALGNARVPNLLRPYCDRLVVVCQHYAGVAARNRGYLDLQQDSLLEDVLSGTQQAALMLRLLSGRMAAPVLRAADADRLCLKVISWMHLAHPAAADIPAAFGDGGPAVWPFLTIAPIYFFPCLEQGGLLYQSLHFHEFGHVLYALHREEMDDLVRELQQRIEAALLPMSQRDDRHADAQAERQRVVVNTWYKWAQEFFCDAVGLALGGPAFLYAFSAYCGVMDRGDFYRPPAELEHSAHPVTWLRVRLLARRARALGFAEAAEELEHEWDLIAATMGAAEDYHEFYRDSMASTVEQAVSDMLIEADPRACTAEEANPPRDWERGDSPAHLMNRAWLMVRADRSSYPEWEARQVASFLGAEPSAANEDPGGGAGGEAANC